jgi:peptidoglycan/LPS O-acetylase OafA/YrhL
MRKAAGILMVVLGLTMMWVYVDALGRDDVDFWLSTKLSFTLFVIIGAVFVITGGLFCLKRKYWVLCFISSLFFNYYVFIVGGSGIFPDFVVWFLIPLGIVPLIFICLRKREWQEISGSVDGEVSYDS